MVLNYGIFYFIIAMVRLNYSILFYICHGYIELWNIMYYFIFAMVLNSRIYYFIIAMVILNYRILLYICHGYIELCIIFYCCHGYWYCYSRLEGEGSNPQCVLLQGLSLRNDLHGSYVVYVTGNIFYLSPQLSYCDIKII